MRVLVAALVLAMTPVALPAMAQLMLHNDPAPAEGGESAPVGSGAPAGDAPAKAKPVVMKPPGDDSVLGQNLLRDGAAGSITLARQGKDIGITKLSLEGE